METDESSNQSGDIFDDPPGDAQVEIVQVDEDLPQVRGQGSSPVSDMISPVQTTCTYISTFSLLNPSLIVTFGCLCTVDPNFPFVT